jgi:hypothetical protein
MTIPGIFFGTYFDDNALSIHPNHSILVDTEFGLPIVIVFYELLEF